jgi:predicted nuclease of predicted toxin-antitoxin system
MKFIVDAQLPRRLTLWLSANGYDALHTLDLPKANQTTDAEIVLLAEQEDRIVITKDADFVNSFLLYRKPPKLLLVATGNITNHDLEALMTAQFVAVVTAFSACAFIELSPSGIVIRG